MKKLKAPLIVGGLLPALILGIGGIFMKASIQAGLGVGSFLVLVGGTLLVLGGIVWWLAGRPAVTPAALLSGIVAGVLWVLGTGLTQLAFVYFNASVSQLAPLYNMNTLIVVLLGLWVFSEWKQVRPVPLFIGGSLMVLGALFVSRA